MAILRDGLVLDIGANVGDWAAAVLAVEPSVSVIAAEPGNIPRAKLTERFANDARVTISSCAVAETPGSRGFHVTAHSHAGSLRVPRPEMNELYGGGWDETGTVDVEVTTVDNLAAGRDVALLKIDVQGAERDVLAGAKCTLPRTSAVLIEVLFVSHYEGDVGFTSLHEHMTDQGFELANLSPMFLSGRRTALWCDACYTRA